MTALGFSIPDSRHGDGKGLPEPARILLYSHDSWGLGHLRRNLNIAGALTSRFADAHVVLVTGSPCATRFPAGERTEIVKIPSVTKNEQGQYVARSLGAPLATVIAMRQRLLMGTYRSFEPNIVIVDHQPIGLEGEMLDILHHAARNGVRTILGIRDVIDAPEAVQRDWSAPSIRWALAEGYDSLCVYGDENLFDPRVEYSLPAAIERRLKFTGYLVRDDGADAADAAVSTQPHERKKVLVTMGGGEDGGPRVMAYLDALALAPADWDTTILTGPMMNEKDVRRIKRRVRTMQDSPGSVAVHRFHADMQRLLRDCDAVACMAGYNVSAEVLQSRRPAVFLPRTHPRCEQEIRADRLSRLGICRSLVDQQPATLRAAIEWALARPRRHSVQLPMDGLARLCDTVADLLRWKTGKQRRDNLHSVGS